MKWIYEEGMPSLENEMDSAVQTVTEGNDGNQSALDGSRELNDDEQEVDTGMNVK